MRREAGFTLIEMVVVTAIIAIVAATLGTFFLAGASPAVASAARDVNAAFDEARRAALASDAATVVFAPAPSGTGYSARIYARVPGDPQFAPRNGPAYASTVTIGEIASPLGAPGFAFSIDSRGTITGFVNFVAGAASATSRPCPASGAFELRLAYASDVRIVTIPCGLPRNSNTPVAFETPPAAFVPTPAPSATCPASETCTLTSIPPPPGATCPPGTTPDATVAGVCDVAAAPTPTPVVAGIPSPTPPPPTAPQGCVAGAPDALGFAVCLESNPIRILGNTIIRAGCGTHTPIADPGATFGVTADVWKDGAPWGSYGLTFTNFKVPLFNLEDRPPDQTCGMRFALNFSITAVTPESGNATTNPYQDSGFDPALADQGAEGILFPPFGGQWGSNS